MQRKRILLIKRKRCGADKLGWDLVDATECSSTAETQSPPTRHEPHPHPQDPIQEELFPKWHPASASECLPAASLEPPDTAAAPNGQVIVSFRRLETKLFELAV